jgi:sigma-B regulation protein RsbU (phosphoserine phosphatase)
MALTINGLTVPGIGTAPSDTRRPTAGEDLRRAALIQHQLLPPSLYTGLYVDVAARTRPCETLGGDFFDYQDTRCGFRVVLGDVCGKGAAAALQAAVVQGILAIEAEVDARPASLMTRLNRALCRRAIPARFVTLFCGVVTPDNRLTYCNAGQCRPILLNHQPARHLSAGGHPLGLFSNASYEEESLTMAAGDTLVVFSDGVTEAQGRSGNPREEFGDSRLLAAVQEQPAASASAILDHLLARLYTFARHGRQRDDVTALVVRYLGAANGELTASL